MNKPSSVSLMHDPVAWEYPKVIEFLSSQLLKGRLAVVLGAGASVGFGLPNWSRLTEELAAHVHCNLPPSLNDAQAGEYILNELGNDYMAFAEAVRHVLYKDFRISMESLARNPLLSAIGALTMTSMRGRVGPVVSFNFDDLLERYLFYHGWVAAAVSSVPSWDGRSDVVVLHPHGLLRSDLSRPVLNPIVYAQIDFDRIVGNAQNTWRRKLLNVFTSNTCLFIGLSGNDANLTNLLTECCENHVSRNSSDAFWGVRFSADHHDPMLSIWRARGVCQLTVEEYSRVPSILFEICQGAAEVSQRLLT